MSTPIIALIKPAIGTGIDRPAGVDENGVDFYFLDYSTVGRCPVEAIVITHIDCLSYWFDAGQDTGVDNTISHLKGFYGIETAIVDSWQAVVARREIGSPVFAPEETCGQTPGKIILASIPSMANSISVDGRVTGGEDQLAPLSVGL
jgi:hypothetical protein